jgi:hypothetical protein
MEAVPDRPSWNPSRRCTATNRAGERCWRQPIPGGYVCVNHGGRAPQVKQSAKARLLAGADLAIDYLVGLLTPRPPCPACGRSDADRDPVVVKACQIVLDRSGFHPTLAVEHVEAPDPYADLTMDEMIERLETMLEQMRAMRDADRARMLEREQEQAVLDARQADAARLIDAAAVDDVMLHEVGGVAVPLDFEAGEPLAFDVEHHAADPIPQGTCTSENWTTDSEAVK